MHGRFFSILICMCLAAVASWADTRVALVIGNAEYRSVEPLINPRNDAKTVADALRNIHFSVIEKYDLTKDGMDAALLDFRRHADHADVALIYYAGHGIEAAGAKYLIPVDAQLQLERDIKGETVPLSVAEGTVEGARALKIIILDACRNNPFAPQAKDLSRAILTRGLSPERNPGDIIFVYATKAGMTASDGDTGNGPFARALARNLVEPGNEIGKLFLKVGEDVSRETHGAQEPVQYASLSGKTYFLVPPKVIPQPPQPEPEPAINPIRVEMLEWENVRNSQNIEDFRYYLKKYPHGLFVDLANAKLNPPPKNVPRPQLAAPTPIIDPKIAEMAYWNKIAIKGKSDSEIVASYEGYLRRYPGGMYVDTAKEIVAYYQPKPVVPVPLPPAPIIDPKIHEVDVWNSVANSSDVSDVQKYLDAYPDGMYVGIARAKIRAPVNLASLDHTPPQRKQMSVAEAELLQSSKLTRTQVLDAADKARVFAGKARAAALRAETVGSDKNGSVQVVAQVMGFTTTTPRHVAGYGVQNGRNSQNLEWRYSGEVSNASQTGVGVMTWGNNSRYEGQFKSDKRTGYGFYITANGDSFEGEFKNDDRVAGVYRFRDGAAWIGLWKHNKLDGYGFKLNAQQVVIEQGFYKEGVLDTTLTPQQ